MRSDEKPGRCGNEGHGKKVGSQMDKNTEGNDGFPTHRRSAGDMELQVVEELKWEKSGETLEIYRH